jgi:hypothetical protein
MAEMQGQQGDIGKMISNVGQGLAMLADLVGKTPGVDPSIPERFGGLVQEFTSLIEAISGGEGGQAPQQPMGTTSPEAGGNPNAMPA